MAEDDEPRVLTAFSLGYRAAGDEAAILGLHVPTPEQQAAGFMPHWEPLVVFSWDQAPALFQMFLDSHAEICPMVERKRQLEQGDLTAQEAWMLAQEEMRPRPPIQGMEDG